MSESGNQECADDTRRPPRPPVGNRVTVVLGAQWGDEGKGKVVDLLAQDADVVCRCQVGWPADPPVPPVRYRPGSSRRKGCRLARVFMTVLL